MASSAINYQDVYGGVLAALQANAAVQAALGDPVRVYTRVPPQTAMPYAQISGIPEGNFTGGKGGKWIRNVGIQFNIYDNDSTCTRVAAALKAIMDVMDTLPDLFSVANYKLTSSVPVIDVMDYDTENAVATAVCSYRMSVERTASP